MVAGLDPARRAAFHRIVAEAQQAAGERAGGELPAPDELAWHWREAFAPAERLPPARRRRPPRGGAERPARGDRLPRGGARHHRAGRRRRAPEDRFELLDAIGRARLGLGSWRGPSTPSAPRWSPGAPRLAPRRRAAGPLAQAAPRPRSPSAATSPARPPRARPRAVRRRRHRRRGAGRPPRPARPAPLARGALRRARASPPLSVALESPRSSSWVAGSGQVSGNREREGGAAPRAGALLRGAARRRRRAPGRRGGARPPPPAHPARAPPSRSRRAARTNHRESPLPRAIRSSPASWKPIDLRRPPCSAARWPAATRVAEGHPRREGLVPVPGEPIRPSASPPERSPSACCASATTRWSAARARGRARRSPPPHAAARERGARRRRRGAAPRRRAPARRGPARARGGDVGGEVEETRSGIMAAPRAAGRLAQPLEPRAAARRRCSGGTSPRRLAPGERHLLQVEGVALVTWQIRAIAAGGAASRRSPSSSALGARASRGRRGRGRAGRCPGG